LRRRLVDVAEFVLQGLKNGQQRAVQMQQFADALLRHVRIPRGPPDHVIPPPACHSERRLAELDDTGPR
jgi:hypothetical protein